MVRISNTGREMLNTTQQNKLRRPDRVIEARAGLIPESDHLEDERRARTSAKARVFRSVRVYAGSVTYGSEGQAIIDILTNLRHYCDCKGLAFQKLDTAAHEVYLEEAGGPA
jgi:hypothetical protein